MLFLAIPMVGLFGGSEVICRFLDRYRARKDELAGLADDERSSLD